MTKILFQATWVILALPCAYSAILLAWLLVSGHLPSAPMSPLPTYSAICLLLLSILICSGVVYAAYRAVFHFSPGVVDVTVTFTMLLMGLFAWAWTERQVMHLTAHHVKHPTSFTLPYILIVGLSPILVIWAGSRVTKLIKRAINKLIFRDTDDLSTS
jgi:hypothetical protein